MLSQPIHHVGEDQSNQIRELSHKTEPRALRTYTPTQAVFSHSAGVYHWTPEGKRLFDFSSGVLVANLGHNPISWTKRFFGYMGWHRLSDEKHLHEENGSTNNNIASIHMVPSRVPQGFFPAVTMTAYNGITPIETEANRRLLKSLQKTENGKRLQQVLWAASGSEGIQKAIWAAMAHDRSRPVILATRFGFHGKKGLANAVTGSENDSERDPRVRFISFPMRECCDISHRDHPFDPIPYQKELDSLLHQYGRKIGTLITEPYLGGGGSYHPPKAYLHLLQKFCRENDIVFILDEVQSNFGRTGSMYAFESYDLEPDIVVLGKGLGNGVPVAAAVGRADLFQSMDYGEGSDTWSANPLCCAAVLATLDEFEESDILHSMKESSKIIENALVQLKEFPFISHVRGESGGLVWGVEFRDYAHRTASEWANASILACYRGIGSPTADGIHLLGPLAKKVVRISPPLVITADEAMEAMNLMKHCLTNLANTQSPVQPASLCT